MKEVLVIGGGITGLATAFYLKKEGISVDVFEKKDHFGGVIHTHQENGFLAEKGPHSIQISHPSILELIKELQLDSSVIYAPDNAQRYVLKNCKITPLPMKPQDFFLNPTLSLKGKLRAFYELFIPRVSTQKISVKHFFKKRFGQEIADYFVDPFISGIYAGNPNSVSLKYAFPKIYNLANTHRSILWYLIKNGIQAPQKVISFKNGMQDLIGGFERNLQDCLINNTKIESISYQSDKLWYMRCTRQKKGFYANYKHVVLAIPGHNLPEIQTVDDQIKQPLENIAKASTYHNIGCFTLGITKTDLLKKPDGFGFLVPSCEPLSILGVLFTSDIFPNRAPEGYCSLAVFVGGALSSSVAKIDQKRLERFILSSLVAIKLIKPKTLPAFSHYAFWPKAIAQYNSENYNYILQQIERIHINCRALHIAGDYYKGLSLPSCIEKAKTLAKELKNRL